MKPIIAFLISALLFLGLGSQPPPHVKALSSVVKVFNYFPETNSLEECSGFAVKPHTYLTAAHCINTEHESYPSLWYDGPTSVGAKLLRVDEKVDLALLGSTLDRPPLKLGPRPALGDRAWLVGFFPNTWQYVFLDGPYEGEWEPQAKVGVKAIFGRQITGGLSGGPVLNEAGEYVSVNQSGNQIISAGPTYNELKAFVK